MSDRARFEPLGPSGADGRSLAALERVRRGCFSPGCLVDQLAAALRDQLTATNAEADRRHSLEVAAEDAVEALDQARLFLSRLPVEVDTHEISPVLDAAFETLCQILGRR